MRKLGFILLFTGLVWACASVPLYRAHLMGTTSVSLEVLTGRDKLSRDEVYDAIIGHHEKMKRISWWFLAPTLVTFCGGVLLSRRPPCVAESIRPQT